MNYKEFRKALESLTDEERYLLTMTFVNKLNDDLEGNFRLLAETQRDIEDSFGMTNERESDVELPDNFGMTRED
jgi:hypothetical protein